MDTTAERQDPALTPRQRRHRARIAWMFGLGVILVLGALLFGVPGLLFGPWWLGWFVLLVLPGVLFIWAAGRGGTRSHTGPEAY